MKTQLFTRIVLTVIALMLTVQLFLNLKPTTVNAQGRLKVVKVDEYSSGQILGFSCVASNPVGQPPTGACYILTRGF